MRERSLPTERTEGAQRKAGLAGWIRTPFGARASGVVAMMVVLALIAGIAVVSQITGQMRNEADARLDAHAAAVASRLQTTIDDASSDIRLARQNVTFENALANSTG